MAKLEQVRKAKSNTLSFQGVDFEVNPFISYSEQGVIIEEYLDTYFSKSVWEAFIAEFTFRKEVCKNITNLDFDNFEVSDWFVLLFETDFFDIVKNEIVNYDDFINLRDMMLEDKKRQIEIDNQIGPIVKELFNNLEDVLANFSKITPEQLNKVKQETKEIVEQINKSDALDKTIKPKKNTTKKIAKAIEYVQ